MDRPPNPVEEEAKSVNPRDQGLPTLDPSESTRSESHALVEPNEALLRISQDMTRVLERLTAPKAAIDMVRRHGVEEFHGTNILIKHPNSITGICNEFHCNPFSLPWE